MSSIHDVARMAGVSTGTVSKRLNGTGYVSAAKCKAIDSAVEALGYVPNRSARQLKTMHSNEVLYIVPNMTEKLYREVLGGIEAVLGGDYRLVVQLTGDNPEREDAILRELLNNPCAGVLLCSCNPDNTQLFERLTGKLPLFFLLRKPADHPRHNFLGFNQSDAVYSLAAELIRLGFHDIGLYVGDERFSCEAECLSAFHLAFAHAGVAIRDNRVFSIPFSKEAIFRSIMQLLDLGDYPPVFITTSFISAQAIHDVAYLRNLELGRDLFLFALGEDSWYNTMFVNRIVSTFRDAQKLGAAAATALRTHIDAPSVSERVNLVLLDGFAYSKVGETIQRLRNNAPTRQQRVTKARMRIAFNATDSGTDALKSLIPQFIKQESVDVEFCQFTHHELHEELVRMADARSGDYDLFSVDAPWLPYLDGKSLLYDLTQLVQQAGIPHQMAPNVLENIGSLNGRVLGLPYVYSLSLLFYRKDLFNDPGVRAQFYKQYKVELRPPNTWNLFNVVAQFFTRSHNPDSPTLYGTSIFGGNFPAAICSELFPRIWAYNGMVFDRRGFVRLYSPENHRACQSLLQTIRCCSPDALGYNAYGSVEQMIAGETAMCVMFSNNASKFADSARNVMKNKIGFAPIPDQHPVRAGWAIGVNRYSDNLPHAFNFIRWFSSMELSSAYTILGGASPQTPLLDLAPLTQLYPWNEVARREYHTGIPRDVPVLPGVPVLDELAVETILSSVIFDCFRGKGSLDELLYRAHLQVCAFAEQSGYPKNAPVSRLTLDDRW